jgi:hypothetical protein
LTTTGDLYACESRTNFDTIINRQQQAADPALCWPPSRVTWARGPKTDG